MAGVIAPVSNQLLRPHEIGRVRERSSVVGDSRIGHESTARPLGEFTDNLPTDLVADTPRPGARGRSYFDDFYNRVYFIPATVDFGAISTNVERAVILWNAHFSNTTLESITLTDSEGIAISDGPEPPYEFLPLGLQTYNILATTAGPASVTATITFTFDSEVYGLRLSGTRAKVSPLVPNWRRPYNVEYSFRTEVLTSRSGKEQRRALRLHPRKKISFEATPSHDQFRLVNRLMASWHNNTIILPEYPREAELAVPINPGGTIVTLTGAVPEWVTERMSVVLSYRGYYETNRVQAFDGNQIVLSSTSGASWPVGTKVHPGLAGRLATSIRSRRQSNAVAEVSVEMDVTPGTEDIIPLDEAPLTFAGYELFMTRPNWIAPPEITYESQREEIDYDRGRIAVFTPIDFATRTTRMTYLGRNFDEADALRQFFERQKGQLGEFYMPTWEPDVMISAESPAGSRGLRIFGTQFAEEFADSEVHRGVAIFPRTGPPLVRKVEDIYVAQDGDVEYSAIQTDEDFPVSLTPANVRMISWLFRWRNATDTLSMEWVTNSVAQCQFTFRTLEAL